MNISAPFIRRPIGTSLLTVALLLSGVLAFQFLPVAPLPQVEFPVISVNASLPGASPETMASSVATPLERQFGRISGVNQMTSTSQLGSTNIVLQFDLSRNIDAAARDVQAAINAARGQLPANLPSNPGYRKVNPADAPILILSMTSDTVRLPEIYDAANSILANKLGVSTQQVATALSAANANKPKGEFTSAIDAWTIDANDQLLKADQYRSLIVASNQNGVVRLGGVGGGQDSGGGIPQA